MLALGVSSALVLRVPCMVCVLRGSLVQCTLAVLVAEQLVLQLWLVAVHIASPLLSPRTNTRRASCACTRALERRVVAEKFGGELGLALLAAVAAATKHTHTMPMVVQAWAAEFGRVCPSRWQ